MKVITTECREVIEQLVSRLQLNDFIDAEEYCLAQQFRGLPIGISLWSYGFLTLDGELIQTEWELGEITRSKETQDIIRALVIAARRFSQLTPFIPVQPKESKICPLCNGTKMWGTKIGSDELAKCVFCAGLGWVYEAT
jgi:hypothetical protein